MQATRLERNRAAKSKFKLLAEDDLTAALAAYVEA